MSLFSSDRAIILLGCVNHYSAKILVAERNPEYNVPRLFCDGVTPKDYYYLKDMSRNGFNIHMFTIIGLSSDTKYIFEIQTTKETREVKLITDKLDNKSIKFLVGSCNLHSLGFLNSPEKPFKTINRIVEREDIDFMLHLGDQIYADIPNPWFKPTFKHYGNYYFDAWADSKETNKLLSKIPNYMIVDDHEIVNNYANRKDKRKYREGIEAYKIFQHSHNPISIEKDRYYYSFNKGIYPFFVMDARLERDRDGKLMIGEKQEENLYTWLSANHPAKFKFICTSVPFLAHLKRSEHDKWTSHYFIEQRNRILEFIAANRIKNVIFLSADVHCSIITESKIYSDNGNIIDVKEIVSSPINQIQKGYSDEFKTDMFESISKKSRMYTGIKHLYSDASNIISISINNGTLNWKLYRTRKNRLELEGTIYATS